MFTEESLKRFRNPSNVGELKDCDVIGESGDPDCSDVIKMFIKIENKKVINAKFKVYGCPGAISTTDVFIDMIKGKTIEESLKITEEAISDALGGLPLTHMHCSNLPIESFRDAIENYKEK
jgi:nitrogen fixation protein NifU and related proteins